VTGAADTVAAGTGVVVVGSAVVGFAVATVVCSADDLSENPMHPLHAMRAIAMTSGATDDQCIHHAWNVQGNN
jgi:hypothetical protein